MRRIRSAGLDPYTDYEVKIAPTELSDTERAALTADDVPLDL